MVGEVVITDQRAAMKFFVPGMGEEQKGKLDRW